MRAELLSHSIATGKSWVRVHYHLEDTGQRPATSCKLEVYDAELDKRGEATAATALGDNSVDVEVDDEVAGPYFFVLSATDDHALDDKMLRTKPALEKGVEYTLPRIYVVGVRFTKTDPTVVLDYNPVYLNLAAQPRLTELPQWLAHVQQPSNELVIDRNDPVSHPRRLLSGGVEERGRMWVSANFERVGEEIPPAVWLRVRLDGHATAKNGTSGDQPVRFDALGNAGQGPWIEAFVSNWGALWDQFYWQSYPLPDVVDEWTLALDWTMQWAYDVNGAPGPWIDVGGQHTYHDLYTTWAEPVTDGTYTGPDQGQLADRPYRYEQILGWSCKWAANKGGLLADADAERAVVEACFEGCWALGTQGYWYDPTTQQKGVDNFLANHFGGCGEWESILHAAVEGQGVDVRAHAYQLIWPYPHEDGWQYQTGSIPAVGRPAQVWRFKNYQVTVYKGVIYDPSFHERQQRENGDAVWWKYEDRMFPVFFLLPSTEENNPQGVDNSEKYVDVT
jgi:hypothetical protein